MPAFSDGPLVAGEPPAADAAPASAAPVTPAPVAIPVVSVPGAGAAAGLALDLDPSELEIAELTEPEPADAELAGDPEAGDAAHPSDADDVPDDHGLSEPGRPSHLRVAPERDRGLLHRRRRAQLVVLGVAALSAASMFLLVTFHVFAAQSAFSLDKLDTQLSSQQREYGLLRDKVATLSSPDAVANGAKRLGMVRSTEVTQLHPQSAPPFAATGSLPVPPLTPYGAQGIDDPGQ